jgi:hypothetical protein
VIRRLDRWIQDSDLDSVRQLQALSQLPEAEAERWSKLWSSVTTSLAARRAG